jgi:hypothetical protein
MEDNYCEMKIRIIKMKGKAKDTGESIKSPRKKNRISQSPVAHAVMLAIWETDIGRIVV